MPPTHDEARWISEQKVKRTRRSLCLPILVRYNSGGIQNNFSDSIILIDIMTMEHYMYVRFPCTISCREYMYIYVTKMVKTGLQFMHVI